LVFSFLLVITSATLLRVTLFGEDAQFSAWQRDKALVSAESGVQLGARWVREQSNLPKSGTTVPFSSRLYLNGVWVDIAISFQDIGSNSRQFEIIATAWDNATATTADHFLKRVRSTMRTVPFTYYGTFFDSATAGWGGFIDRVFDGRFHMNRSILISYDASRPDRFTDLVTVANKPTERWNYGTGNNNYNAGVQLNNYSGSGKVAILDSIFKGEYRSDQERIDIPQALTDLNTTLIDGRQVNLPLSTKDEGTGASDYRPTLRFNSNGSATYIYYNSTKLDSVTYANIDQKVYYSQNNMNIYGVVKGNSTVISKVGKSMAYTGDLTYADYNKTTGTIAGNTNALGLVSGKDLVFLQTWKKTPTSSTIKVDYDNDGKLHINAATVALNSGAKEYWDYGVNYTYDLTYTGSHFLKMWYPPSSGSNGADQIIFKHDTRLISDVVPIGFPAIKADGNLWKITQLSWAEDDVY